MKVRTPALLSVKRSASAPPFVPEGMVQVSWSLGVSSVAVRVATAVSFSGTRIGEGVVITGAVVSRVLFSTARFVRGLASLPTASWIGLAPGV